MSIIISKQWNLCNNELENELLEQIGDGQKSIFIKESENTKELLNNSLEEIYKDFGQDIIDGKIVQKKLGLIYLSDKDYESSNRMQIIVDMIPSLQYIKGDNRISTKDYIKQYGFYDIYIKEKNYHLSAVLYTEEI